MRPIRLLIAASLCSALALACAGAAPAATPTVGNPGVFGALVTDMAVQIGGGAPGSGGASGGTAGATGGDGGRVGSGGQAPSDARPSGQGGGGH